MVPQQESKRKHDPLQEEDQNGESTGEFENDSAVFFSDVRLQVAQEITGAGEDEDGDGALEDAGEDGGDHVGGVALVGGGGGDGEGGDGDEDGEDVEEDEEEADEGGEEAEGEGEEDEA